MARGSFLGGLATARGAVVRAIQRQLATVRPEHPLRQWHARLRKLKVVSFLWRRVLGADTRDWFDIGSYRRLGGRFAAPVQAADVSSNATAWPTGHDAEPEWGFMDQVAGLASCHEPSYTPENGRVVLVNCSLAAGGAERQLLATLKGLKAKGYDPIFIGEFIGGGDPALDFYLPALRAIGVIVERAYEGPLPGPDFYADVTEPLARVLSAFELEPVTRLLGMVRHLRRLRPAVVHLWQDQTSVLHGLAALIARVPRIVLSGRNVEPTHFGYSRPWLRSGYRVLAAQPQVVMTNNSQAGADAYVRWLGLSPCRISVILNAVQLPDPLGTAERAAGRARFGADDASLLVAGVMRMSAEKQPLLWLETAARLAAAQPRARFVLAGDGPMMADVSARAKSLGLAGCLTLTGEIEDVRSVQGAADVVLLTSSQEGTPNVLLEAQALETPVVTTDAGGAGACVLPGRTGLVVPLAHANPAQLASAVLAATSLGPPMRRFGTGRAHMAAAFSEDAMIAATLQAYGLEEAPTGKHTTRKQALTATSRI